MNTLLIKNRAQEKSTRKSGRNKVRNKTILITKTETFRSGNDARDRAQQLMDTNVGSVFILEKRIEVFYVRYKIAR